MSYDGWVLEWRPVRTSIKEEEYDDAIERWIDDAIDSGSIEYGKNEASDDEELDALLLTINPAPSVDVRKFIRKVHNFVERKTVSPYIWAYAFEQRSKFGEPKGFHVHLVAYDIAPSLLHRWAYSTFKNMVGNPEHVNVKKINYDRGIRYLEGYKKNKRKRTHKKDILFRNKYSLKDIYYL